MSQALSALSGIPIAATRNRRLVAVISAFAVVVSIGSVVASLIPLVGPVLSIPVGVVGIGGMYGALSLSATDRPVTLSGVAGVVKARALSIGGGYVLLFASYVLVLLAAALVIVPVAVLSGILTEGIETAAADGIVLVAILAVFAGAHLLYSAFAQLLFPAIVIDSRQARSVLRHVYELVTQNARSVFGFTVLRVVVEYGILAVGLAIAVAVAYARDTVGTLENADAAAASGTSLLSLVDAVTLVGVVAPIVAAVILSQAAKAIYVGEFYTRLTQNRSAVWTGESRTQQ
jgi:hypothetical protein